MISYSGRHLQTISVQHGSVVTFAIPRPAYVHLEDDSACRYLGASTEQYAYNPLKAPQYRARLSEAYQRLGNFQENFNRNVAILHTVALEFHTRIDNEQYWIQLQRILEEELGVTCIVLLEAWFRSSLASANCHKSRRVGEWLEISLDRALKYYGDDHSISKEIRKTRQVGVNRFRRLISC